MRVAAESGLRVAERWTERPGSQEMVRALGSVNGADIVNLRSPVDAESRRVLFRVSSAVLANSGHEPFGMVGLEAMAAGGIACTGCSGEDYVVPGHNALVLETDDPREFVGLMRELRSDPQRERSIRRSAQATARQYAWSRIISRIFLPRLRTLRFAGPTPVLA